MYIATEKLWLTEDRNKVVKDGDPAAAFLLVPKGGQLTDADAEKYGLTAPKVETPVPDAGKANPAPAENKANSGPAENKAGVQYPPQAKRK